MSCVRKTYLSCYSCPYSTIFTSEKDKMVECGLTGERFRLEKGRSYPDFCEIRAVNNRGKGRK